MCADIRPSATDEQHSAVTAATPGVRVCYCCVLAAVWPGPAGEQQQHTSSSSVQQQLQQQLATDKHMSYGQQALAAVCAAIAVSSSNQLQTNSIQWAAGVGCAAVVLWIHWDNARRARLQTSNSSASAAAAAASDRVRVCYCCVLVSLG